MEFDNELAKVIAILGTQSRLAKALGLSDNAVSKWVAQGKVPPGRALQVAKLVEGRRTACGQEVTLESLLLDSTKATPSIKTKQ